MKVKTIVTLSAEVLSRIKCFVGEGERSEFIEKALWKFFEIAEREKRNKRDAEIYEKRSAYFNKEADDVLSFQSDP